MCFFRSWGTTGWNFTAHFLEHKGKKDKHRNGLAADGEREQPGESLWDRKKSVRDAYNKSDTDSDLLDCLYFLTSKTSSRGSWELKSYLTSPSEPAPINASQRAPE